LVVVGLSTFSCSKSSDYDVMGPGNGNGRDIDAGAHDAAPVDGNGDAGSTPDGPADNSPTVIEMVTPKSPFLIAGVMQLDLHITDADGVASVAATIGGATHPIALEHAATQTEHWVAQFDTQILAGVLTPSIEVTVVDQLGRITTAGFPITLDNASPLAAMDPPRVRMFNFMDKTCSDSFDPVGDDAPNDRQTVAQLSEFRARVEDRSNTGTVNDNSPVFIPLAGIDPTVVGGAVKLNVLHATGVPLAIDSDGDGKCDRINPDSAPVAINLVAAPPAGAAFFGPTTFAGSNLGCKLGTQTASQPVCDGEPGSTIVLKTPYDAPAIYGIPEVNQKNCLGFVFDTHANSVPDGWACVAVEAVDKLGNRNVSAPIRVCINSAGIGHPSALCGEVGRIASVDDPTLPNCTGTLNTTTNVVTTQPCAPETFVDSGTLNDYELIRQ
jgi:hypothetical protein